MTEVRISDRAAGWLERAEPDVRDRILAKLDEVVYSPGHYLKRLRGREEYRLRVGDYRVIVDWRREESVIVVREIGHRRNIYE